MNSYSVIGRIGEGAHGIVVKAKHKETGELVALKKIPLKKGDDSITNTALREIKALQVVEQNPYIVELRDVFPHGTGFVLVFEYMMSDLSEIVKSRQSAALSESMVKRYMLMLLQGVNFMHEHCIMHRDLKPANLLISSNGILKIADFGLARVFQRDKEKLYSHQVATRWYRAPELLYGARKYSSSVDIWSVGCIFGELLNQSPLFPGENDIEQLWFVIRALGTPDEKEWPELTELPDYNKISFAHCKPIEFDELLPDANAESIEFLTMFLKYSPDKRITASQALVHKYFFSKVLPAPYSELIRPAKKECSLVHAQQRYECCIEHPTVTPLIHDASVIYGSRLSEYFKR